MVHEGRHEGVIGDEVACVGRHCVEQVEGVGEGVRPAQERGEKRVVGVSVLVRKVVEGRDRSGRRWEPGVERDEAIGQERMAGERRLDEARVHCAAETEHVPRGDGPLQERNQLRDGERASAGRGRGWRRCWEAWRRVDGERRVEAAHAFPTRRTAAHALTDAQAILLGRVR